MVGANRTTILLLLHVQSQAHLLPVLTSTVVCIRIRITCTPYILAYISHVFLTAIGTAQHGLTSSVDIDWAETILLEESAAL